MTKKHSLWISVVFVLTLLISLLINTPAAQVFRFVELPAQLGIKGLNGSITRGEVELLSYQGFQLVGVEFEFQPSCLFRAAICYQLQADEKQLMAVIEANLLNQGVSLKKSQITLDSDILSGVQGLIVKPRGAFRLHVENLSYMDSRIVALEAKVDWTDAGIQGEDQLLGNYHALINREAKKLTVKLSDSKSLLSLSGGIDINWDGSYQADVKFESQPGLNQSVKSALEIMAKKTGLNRFSLKRGGVVAGSNLTALKLIAPVE